MLSAHVPAWFLRRVKAIDPELNVEWLPREERFAITQILHNTPSLEDLVALATTELVAQLMREGELIPDRHALNEAMYDIVAADNIVLRIEERDGTPRPLDGRTLELLRQMAWNRRNRTVRDWREAGAKVDYEMKRARERATADRWAYAAKDDTFRRIMRNTLQGLGGMRNMSVGGLPNAGDAAAAAG